MEELNRQQNIAYGNEVISKIEKERDQVRDRPNLFFGTDDVYGALNGVMELVVNGADELGAGYGDTVSITVDEDYNIAVADNGRGVPMDWSESQQKYNWDLVYNQMYASGKRKAGAYDSAAGLNGVGASITQFTALYMKVISRRVEKLVDASGREVLRKIEYEMNFRDGYPVGELIKRDWAPNATGSGTIVLFKTDPTVFQDVRFTVEMLAEKLRRLATVKGGHHYIVNFMDQAPVDFYFEDGPKSVLDALVPNKLTAESIQFRDTKIVNEVIKGKMEEFNVTVTMTFTFSVDGAFRESYHNGLYLVEHGTSVDGFRAGIVSVLDTWGKNNNKLNAKDKLTNVDIDEILCFIVSTEFIGDFSSWDGQDKKAIKNNFLKGVCQQIVADKFSEWASAHSAEMNKIFGAVMELRTARAKAAAVKSNIIRKLSAGVSNFKTRPAKLVDCESTDTRENELYIVEGESAKGTAVLARNQKFQAVYPLTGKILNCDKATLEAIFHNKVILDLIQTTGCGVEVDSKYLKDLPKFDISKLNYGKIVFNTDADDDGFHIQCLLLVMYYKLMPSLIKAGRVFIAEAPLFMLTYTLSGAKSKEYTYSIEEKDNRVAELQRLGAKGLDIYRFKGLGEMDSRQMSETTMNPQTRRLTPVEWPADEEAFEKLMHELMGDDLVQRKSLIAEYFANTTGEYDEEGIEISDGDAADDDFVAAVVE